jgi:hypothetical protein
MEKVAIWASAHKMTGEQKSSLESQGFNVLNLKDVNPELFNRMIAMQIDTDRKGIAEELKIICDNRNAVIVQPGGDPAFQQVCGKVGVPCMFAFSQRISEDIPQDDGSIKKVSIFKFEGWVNT